jgi:glycosyltransferase involved in cell wall biosynthesis
LLSTQEHFLAPVGAARSVPEGKIVPMKAEKPSYVIITPVRDEEEHIEDLLKSVTAQSIRPAEWIIVDDGSTDKTGEILDRYVEPYPWIRVLHRNDRGFRKAGGGVMEAFYDGFRTLRCTDWEFVVKLDGDLRLQPDYFEKCFEHFAKDPQLGIGGGDIYHEIGGQLQLEHNPRFHVRGATKIYSRPCWEAIGGLWPAAGWDTIDEVKANMLGWKTYSFSDLRLLHHRFTGAADGLIRDRIKYGEVCYVAGYHPLFLLARCFYRLVQKPYFIGSLATLYGFLRAYWTHLPRVEDPPFVAYIRSQQLRRLFGLETIWR